MHRVDVGNNEISRTALTIFQHNSAGAAVSYVYSTHGLFQLNPNADFTHQSLQAVDKRAGPTHREVNPPASLEEMNEVVDTRCVERIAADEHRLNRECLAQTIILQVLADQLPHAPVRAQAYECRQLPEHGR